MVNFTYLNLYFEKINGDNNLNTEGLLLKEVSSKILLF
jgi:hypothetical protein